MSPLKSFINRITGNTSVKTEPLNYNACPACLEPIPNSFSERHCNNCHYIFSQFPMEIAKFYLDWEYFTYKGKEYKYEEIIRLYVCTKKTVYLLKETSECKVILNMSSGEAIKATDSNTNKMQLMSEILRIRSINNRFKHYMQQLHTNGYIEYIGDNRLFSNGKIFGKSLRINSDGTITHGNKTYDLKAANKKNSVL